MNIKSPKTSISGETPSQCQMRRYPTFPYICVHFPTFPYTKCKYSWFPEVSVWIYSFTRYVYKKMAGVYLMKNSETGEKLYIGSTIHLRSREMEHRNPNFPNHAAFGKYIHKEGLLDKLVMEVLEPVKHEDREMRKKLCRRQEFVWKKKIPCKFCEVYDGLSLQPKDVQLKHKLEKREATREHRRILAREYYKTYFTPEKKIRKNHLARVSHARRRLDKDGVVIKTREMGLTRDEKLAKRRRQYAARKLADGKEIKARGRVPKPPRLPRIIAALQGKPWQPPIVAAMNGTVSCN
jgi:predicted GIY-YIG superfamily endonuclease